MGKALLGVGSFAAVVIPVPIIIACVHEDSNMKSAINELRTLGHHNSKVSHRTSGNVVSTEMQSAKIVSLKDNVISGSLLKMMFSENTNVELSDVTKVKVERDASHPNSDSDFIVTFETVAQNTGTIDLNHHECSVVKGDVIHFSVHLIKGQHAFEQLKLEGFGVIEKLSDDNETLYGAINSVLEELQETINTL